MTTRARELLVKVCDSNILGCGEPRRLLCCHVHSLRNAAQCRLRVSNFAFVYPPNEYFVDYRIFPVLPQSHCSDCGISRVSLFMIEGSSFQLDDAHRHSRTSLSTEDENRHAGVQTMPFVRGRRCADSSVQW